MVELIDWTGFVKYLDELPGGAGWLQVVFTAERLADFPGE
jgi:hypothetical protein